MSRFLWAIALILAFSGIARAEPEAASGEGRELFIARCSSCHSVDYIEMHARFGTRALWESQVLKMRNAYKAPMSDDDAKVIVDYLERYYGPARVDLRQRTTPSSSISKTSVAPGLITGGAPRSP